MSIDPMKSGSADSAGGARSDQTGSNQAARQSGQTQRSAGEGRNSESGGDKVQLSAEARGASGLSADRLQEILKRLTSGYYDSARVVNRVAERIHKDLTGSGAGWRPCSVRSVR